MFSPGSIGTIFFVLYVLVCMLQVLYVFGMPYGGVVVLGRVYGSFTYNLTCLIWLISLPRCIQVVFPC